MSMKLNLPKVGTEIVFLRVPAGSYASVGIAYRVIAISDRYIHIESRSLRGTFDTKEAWLVASWKSDGEYGQGDA